MTTTYDIVIGNVSHARHRRGRVAEYGLPEAMVPWLGVAKAAGAVRAMALGMAV